MKTKSMKYLLKCINEHIDFRLPELTSICSMFSVCLKWLETPTEAPFMLVSATEAEICKVVSRSILIHSCYELWGIGTSEEELHISIKENMDTIFKNNKYSEKSFRIQVDTYGKSLTLKNKIEKIKLFNYLPLKGNIKLNNPELSLHLHEFYGLNPNETKFSPLKLYFGRWICNGHRSHIHRYNLKNRKFLGNTSMDPQLSFIMTNMAQIQENHLVLDPFVGTGSLLIAAAHFGAYVWGTDISYLMLHGRTKPTRYQQKIRQQDECVQENLKQYGMNSKYLDIMVADASLPLWHSNLQFDAIITDPPYGIREATWKIGSKKEYTIDSKYLLSHIPSKISYHLTTLYQDMFTFAGKHLRLNGKLVTWLPVYREDYDPKLLPSHPCLSLVANSEQVLTSHSSRHLITMEKIHEWSTDMKVTKINKNNLDTFRQKFFQALNINSKRKEII